MKTFSDIKVFFNIFEHQAICSSFAEVLNLIPDDGLDPFEYGYTQQEIDNCEAPESEFEHEMRICLADFRQVENGYETNGTNYLLLCKLLGQMLDRYSFVLFDVGQFDPSDTDGAEDLQCICVAIFIVLGNKAFFECKDLARQFWRKK